MKKQQEFLDPSRMLVDEVVGWLCGNGRFAGRVRLVDGARSLAHVMVVVPTAQSGRTLRLALAREAAKRGWGGILPPKVVLPMQLVKPADAAWREATPVEAAFAFQQYVKTHRAQLEALDRIVGPETFEDASSGDLAARFALFDQMEDIWRALAGRGLLMRDVPAVAQTALEADVGDEVTRWQQLAQLETGYFDYLHAHGVAYPTEAVRAAKTHAAIVAEEIGEIVLPALADPVRVLGDVLEQQLAAGKRVTVLLHTAPEEAERFDAWGWPKSEAWTGRARPVLDRLGNGDLVCATNVTALARLVAEDCPAASAKRALPSLALCDDELYQDVAAAFLNRGYAVHNPERHRLAESSLGRLLKDLLALYPEGDLSWRACLSALRGADLQAALGLDAEQRAAVLRGADLAQNAFIPSVVPRGFSFPSENGIPEWQQKDYAAFLDAGRAFERMLNAARQEGASLGLFLRRMLQTVFAAHRLGERVAEKEFLAAAESARDFLAALEGDFIAAFAPTRAEAEALARRTLDAATYSLEPDAADAVKTEGWLEMPWTEGARIALVGLHEGKVPDSIVGHPFLPDTLRKALGLVANADRLARDTWILKELLDSHARHAVRAYVARTSDKGDICRPSRLLYLCADADLPARVRTLFGDLPVVRTDRRRQVEWPLALPDAVKAPRHLSASALDTYVKCPFTYLLKYGLGMRPYEEKRELGANDFGTYVHEVLRRYAEMQIARGDDQLTDPVEILRVIREAILPACRARFVKPTLNMALQLRAAEGRLALFAVRQAAWAKAGWRIRAAECSLDGPVQELGVRILGKIDRVDERIGAVGPQEKRWCLIDYKTWDEKKLTDRVVTSSWQSAKNEAHLDLARRLGFPCVKNAKGEARQRMLSVQLPVYGLGYAACHPETPFADMQFSYFILGKDADQTGEALLSEEQVATAVVTAKRAVDLIGKSVFWPPGPTDEWKRDYANLFVSDPMADLGKTDWARRQAAKLEEAHV